MSGISFLHKCRVVRSLMHPDDSLKQLCGYLRLASLSCDLLELFQSCDVARLLRPSMSREAPCQLANPAREHCA